MQELKLFIWKESKEFYFILGFNSLKCGVFFSYTCIFRWQSEPSDYRLQCQMIRSSSQLYDFLDRVPFQRRHGRRQAWAKKTQFIKSQKKFKAQNRFLKNPHYHAVFTVVIKNWDPLLFLPVLAIDNTNFLCLRLKFSSGKEPP